MSASGRRSEQARNAQWQNKRKADARTTAGCGCPHCAFSRWCIVHRRRSRRAEIIDRVLAVVSGAVIMQSDVLAAFELGMVAPGTTDDPMAAVLSQLIDRQLMLAEVDRYVPPEPSADAIDRAAQQVRARFATASAYDAALARSGMGEERLRRLLRDELRIRAYLDERFIVPPPGDDELGQVLSRPPRHVHARRSGRAVRRRARRDRDRRRHQPPRRADQRLGERPAPPRRHQQSLSGASLGERPVHYRGQQGLRRDTLSGMIPRVQVAGPSAAPRQISAGSSARSPGIERSGSD